jgi:hypothetical protein
VNNWAWHAELKKNCRTSDSAAGCVQSRDSDVSKKLPNRHGVILDALFHHSTDVDICLQLTELHRAGL